MRNTTSSIFFVVLAVPGLFAPVVAQAANTYQDCLLEATRKGFEADRRTIGKIKQACRERFPRTAPDTGYLKLDDKALEGIDLYTSTDNDNNLKITVYNGNPDVTLTQMTILLTPNRGEDAVQEFFDSEEYDINLEVPPNKTKHFTIEDGKTDIEGRYRWTIVRAIGY